MSTIDALPNHLVSKILEHLDGQALTNVRRASRAVGELAADAYRGADAHMHRRASAVVAAERTLRGLQGPANGVKGPPSAAPRAVEGAEAALAEARACLSTDSLFYGLRPRFGEALVGLLLQSPHQALSRRHVGISYIDRLPSQDMQGPVIHGLDPWRRPYFAVQVHNPRLDRPLQVATFFQRYANETGCWSIGGDYFLKGLAFATPGLADHAGTVDTGKVGKLTELLSAGKTTTSYAFEDQTFEDRWSLATLPDHHSPAA